MHVYVCARARVCVRVCECVVVFGCVRACVCWVCMCILQLLRADETLAVWRSLYYCGTIIPLALMILFKVIPIKRKKGQKEE